MAVQRYGLDVICDNHTIPGKNTVNESTFANPIVFLSDLSL